VQGGPESPQAAFPIKAFSSRPRRIERAVAWLPFHHHPSSCISRAAILVASIRLHGLDVTLNLNWAGATEMRCDHAFDKGEELGWFEHGSTIIVLAPRGLRWAAGISPGQRIRVGQALLEGARGGAGPAMPGPVSSP
ncbi:MAG: phosphatidylserine decarboxylase, partial [Rubrivivax sp.]